ncbi:MAG: phosphoribosylanthranilate isomerase [Bryobacteraceae bacterium]
MNAAHDISFVIKICGITNEEDAKLAIEAGANALGFNFYSGSPRYIKPARAREIVQAVQTPFLKVGVFVSATEEQLANAAAQVPLDVLQLHGDNCSTRFPRSYRVWKSIVAEDAAADTKAGTAMAGIVEAYVLDAPSPHFGGSGKSFDWSLAASFAYRKIIAGGLDSTNVADAIRTAQPWGVDACSRLEASPGKKDGQRIRDFVNAVIAARPQEIAL